MSDKFEQERFATPDDLLRNLQERAEDLEFVEIFGPGAVITNGAQTLKPNTGFFVALHFISGKTKLIHPDDGEMLLNDGILNRLKVKVRFAKVES